MHLAIQLRLQWLLDTYLPERFPEPGAVVFLDLGRYEDPDRPRSLLLAERGYRPVELPAADPEQHERIPADFQAWPEIADASVDLVLSTHALEHAAAPWLTVAAITRVLKPGGLVCLIEPGMGERTVFANDSFSGAPQRLPAYMKHPLLPDFFRFSDASLRAMAESAGLSVEHASMNCGPAEPPDGWFAYSEVILLATKPRPDETARAADAGEPSLPPLLPTTYAAHVRNADTAAQSRDAAFSLFRQRPATICVVGASLARGLALYLRKAARQFTVKYRSIQNVNQGQTGKVVFSVTDAHIEDADIVIVDDNPGLHHLTCRGGMALRFPVLSFRGFHPDILAPALPWQGVRGSCIVAESWLRGYSESKALSFFHTETYERLGYYAAWESSVGELRRRFAAVDMELGDFLPYWLERGVFMCEALHPRDFVIKDVADAIFARHGLPIEKTMENFTMEHELRHRTPVYPEIAERLHMPEAGSYVFRRTCPVFPPWEWEDCLSLDEYIHLSYEGYREHPNVLAASFIRIKEL